MTAAQTITAKEFAELAGLSAETVRRRLKLFRERPKHPLAIPHRTHLGRPYQIPLKVADALLEAAPPAKVRR